MHMLVLEHSLPQSPNCRLEHSFYRILGSNTITGLTRRAHAPHDMEVGAENVYLIIADGIYEVFTQIFDSDDHCVHELHRYYSYAGGALQRLTESQLLEHFEHIKDAARMREHPDGGQK